MKVTKLILISKATKALEIDEYQKTKIINDYRAFDEADLKQIFKARLLAELLVKVGSSNFVDIYCNCEAFCKFSKTSAIFQRAYFLKHYFGLIQYTPINNTVKINGDYHPDYVGIRASLTQKGAAFLKQCRLDYFIDNEAHAPVALAF